MGKYIAGMKPFKYWHHVFLPQRAIARAQKSKFIPPSRDWVFIWNFSSRLNEIPATDAGISPRRDGSGII